MSSPGERAEGILAAAADAARRALYDRCDDGVAAPESSTAAPDAPFLQGMEYPAICITADRADGAPGGVTLCTTPAGTRALAIRSLDPLPPEANDEPLQDGDLDAAREWATEVFSALSQGLAGVLGAPLALGPPTARAVAAAGGAPGRDDDAPTVLRMSIPVHGEPLLLLLSMAAGDGAATGAPASAAGPPAAAPGPGGGSAPPSAAAPTASQEGDDEAFVPLDDAVMGALMSEDDAELDAETAADISGTLSGTRVRVWAELGQTQLPLRRAVDLPVGDLVELDCDADAPVDLYVNGLRFAQGQLVITPDGEWALRIDEIDESVAVKL